MAGPEPSVPQLRDAAHEIRESTKRLAALHGPWLAAPHSRRVQAQSDVGLLQQVVCRCLGLGTEPRHVEGMGSRLKRLVERGILAEPSSGLFKVDGRGQGW